MDYTASLEKKKRFGRPQQELFSNVTITVHDLIVLRSWWQLQQSTIFVCSFKSSSPSLVSSSASEPRNCFNVSKVEVIQGARYVQIYPYWTVELNLSEKQELSFKFALLYHGNELIRRPKLSCQIIFNLFLFTQRIEVIHKNTHTGRCQVSTTVWHKQRSSLRRKTNKKASADSLWAKANAQLTLEFDLIQLELICCFLTKQNKDFDQNMMNAWTYSLFLPSWQDLIRLRLHFHLLASMLSARHFLLSSK